MLNQGKGILNFTRLDPMRVLLCEVLASVQPITM